MRWTEKHDIFFLRELLVNEPYLYKKGSAERGKCYENLSQILNSATEIKFKVSTRSVRDHLKVLINNFKRKNREEEKASGIEVLETEVDVALGDIVDRFKEADEEQALQNEKKAKDIADQAKAAEMRKRSLETFSETRDRNSSEDITSPKRSRNNGSDTINYLREKGERDEKLKREELELKKEEQKNQRDMMLAFQQQQQQMLQQMQMQQVSVLALLDKLLKK